LWAAAVALVCMNAALLSVPAIRQLRV
jgi:hypothetical protein